MESSSSSAPPIEELRKEQLKDFVSSEKKVVTEELLAILEEISKTGVSIYPWEHMKVLLSTKLREIVADFTATDTNSFSQATETLNSILSNLQDFREAPFTLQRLCELLLQPRQYYHSSKKYLFAVEKMVTVNIGAMSH